MITGYPFSGHSGFYLILQMCVALTGFLLIRPFYSSVRVEGSLLKNGSSPNRYGPVRKAKIDFCPVEKMISNITYCCYIENPAVLHLLAN